MAKLMGLSSWVAFGHVGLSAAAPTVQALGHGLTQLPTVILSNHPGWPRAVGRPVPVDVLTEMLDAIADNGWLPGHDAVLTGYLPTPGHVALACAVIDRLRPLGARIVVDPVLGDDPGGLYLPPEVAAALRDDLAPRADVLTPNLFELGWLIGTRPDTMADTEAAARALRAATGAEIVVTSPPLGASDTGLLHVTDGTALYRTRRRSGVPHGVGDVLSALIAAGLPPGAALGRLDALIAQSAGAPHLRIAETAATWTAAAPVPATRI